MSAQQQSTTVWSIQVARQQLTKLWNSIKNSTRPILEMSEPKINNAVDHIRPYYDKSKEYCKQNKTAILVTTAVIVTYLLTRSGRKDETKEKKKKTVSTKKQIGNKTFISDDSDGDIHDQPSTGTRREGQSSGRQYPQKKKIESNILERIQSSQEQQESEDKIFFQVYKTYQVSSSD